MSSHSAVVLQFPIRPVPLQQMNNIARQTLPVRLKNAHYRSREYLTEHEVEMLIEAAGRVGRHGHRDAVLIMLAYRHGLRVTELVNLRWEQFDIHQGLIHINRVKRGTPSVHPLRAPEILALRQLQEIYSMTPYVFGSERKAPLSADAFRKIISRAGKEAKLPFPVHPHMLRHACGYKLAQAGQDTRAIQHYLGHKNIHYVLLRTMSRRFTLAP